MDKCVRIVLADDHTILREGLRALLSADPKFEIVGEAADGRMAVRSVEKLAPDLVMMDNCAFCTQILFCKKRSMWNSLS